VGELQGEASDNDDLIGPPPEYPPSSADRIIQFCPTLAHCAEQRGDIEEPLWRAMLGVVKYTVEGEERAHHWSAGHADYSEEETQEKIDRWIHGPTTCDHFRGTNGNLCGGCERKCTSPIQLGYSEDAIAPVVAELAGADVQQPVSLCAAESEPAPIAHWPSGFRWDGQHICVAKRDDEGVVHWVPFCDTLFYVKNRIRNEDETWSLQVEYVKKDKYRGEFTLPTTLLGEPGKLHAAMAAQEIVLTGTQGKNYGQQMLSQHMLNVQMAGIQQLTYAKCGWADKYRSFVVGNKRITSAGEEAVLCGDQIKSAGWNKDLGVSGTLEEWVSLIDMLYNRPKAEPYQFVIGAALAAPLVEIAEIDNWHGIPVALTGEGGTGKTTTTRLACSIYGKGEHFLRSATQEGSTLNAIVSRMGVARNLPLVLDEATNRSVDEICALLYMLSNGRPKDRVTVKGQIIDLGQSWNTIAFVTANKNITEFLATLPERFVTEATQVRCFEIQLAKTDIAIWNDINGLEIIEHKLGDIYGVAGRVWLRHVMQHRGALREEIRELRAKFQNDSADETKERYFRDLIVSVMVALRHATNLGLINFDIEALARWAKNHIKTLRSARRAHQYTPEESVAHFLMSLHGRILLTDKCRDGRVTTPEAPMEQLRGAPLARMALGDKVFMVSVKAVNDYCIENKLQPSWLIEQMNRLDYVLYRVDSIKDNGIRKDRMCKGTNLPSMPVQVLELDYAKVLGLMGGSKDNVVQLAAEAAKSAPTNLTKDMPL
jgi:hypothetical protein